MKIEESAKYATAYCCKLLWFKLSMKYVSTSVCILNSCLRYKIIEINERPRFLQYIFFLAVHDPCTKTAENAFYLYSALNSA
jgi:hypothetical protein